MANGTSSRALGLSRGSNKDQSPVALLSGAVRIVSCLDVGSGAGRDAVPRFVPLIWRIYRLTILRGDLAARLPLFQSR